MKLIVPRMSIFKLKTNLEEEKFSFDTLALHSDVWISLYKIDNKLVDKDWLMNLEMVSHCKQFLVIF